MQRFPLIFKNKLQKNAKTCYKEAPDCYLINGRTTKQIKAVLIKQAVAKCSLLIYKIIKKYVFYHLTGTRLRAKRLFQWCFVCFYRINNRSLIQLLSILFLSDVKRFKLFKFIRFTTVF